MARRNNWAFRLIVCVLLTVLGLGWLNSESRVKSHLEEALVYREALIQSGAAFVVIDSDGKIVRWSDGATELFGVKTSEAVGYGLAFMLPRDMREQHRIAFESFVASGHTRHIQEIRCRALRSDYSEIDVVINVRAFTHDGQLLFGAIIDRADDVQLIEARS